MVTQSPNNAVDFAAYPSPTMSSDWKQWAQRLIAVLKQEKQTVPTELILASPDGTKWRITIDDAGVVSGTAL
jgi:hypothetical protein